MLIVLKNHRITGGLGKKLAERVKDDNSIDNKSHILKRLREKEYTMVELTEFKIIDGNYNNNKWQKGVWRVVNEIIQTKCPTAINTIKINLFH